MQKRFNWAFKQRGGCTGGALRARTWGNSFHSSAFKFFSVWHDIKARWPPGGHQRAARGGKQEGRGVKSGAKCVWETGVIHTLLIPTQLRSAQSPGHLAERGALCGTLSSVCEWKFPKKKEEKRPPVNQQPYISFASIWLIRASVVHSVVLLFYAARRWEISCSERNKASSFLLLTVSVSEPGPQLGSCSLFVASHPVTLSGPVRR